MLTSQNSSGKCPFSERFLQIVWNEGLLLPNLTVSGQQPLKIIHPGLWNTGPGPDFRDAALLLNNRLLRGDVEIHCCSSDWFQHRHHRDPLYSKVILHAVWVESGRPAFLPDSNHRPIPTLVLADAMTPDWRRLLTDAEEYNYSYARKIPPGSCSMRWMLTDNETISRILLQAAKSRLSRKIRRLQKLSAEKGPGQALYEAVFDALGYQKNRKNFQQLAAALPLQFFQREALPTAALPSVFLGSAGLLPDFSDRFLLPEAVPFLREAWDCWWQTGLPRLHLDWQMAGCRPYNHPVRRIAAGFFWLMNCRFLPEKWLDGLFAGDCSRTTLSRLIRQAFQGDPFWRKTLNFYKSVPPGALLGAGRQLDLLGNIFIPFAMTRTGDSCRQESLWKLYQQLPPAQSNHLVKEAVHRFLIPPARAREILRKNCLQQGLQELYQNFCLALHNDCSSCPFCHEDRPSSEPDSPFSTETPDHD